MQKKTTFRKSKIPWEAFDRKMRKFRLIASGVIVFLLICAGGLLFVLTQSAQKKTQTVRPTIALVNEDQMSTFNDISYNFGQSFVNLVSNDNKYNWQVVSRSVADRAYLDGSVQAIIYLPQNFTQNILTLQAIDPQKAQVDYKVQNSQSELTNNLLQDKIVNLLYDFNTSIVKMYYASVAGNVASAQTNMGNVVTSQGSILTSLKSAVYDPFQTTNQSYSSVISTATGLKSQNDSWIQAQNSFTNSVTTMLKGDSESFNGTLPGLTNYFNTQKQITDSNLANANKGIAAQATSDNTYDFNQYTTAYNQSLNSMQQFDNTDSLGNETGVYANLKKQITIYNGIISNAYNDISTQIDSLTSQQGTLLGLEKELYSQFFAQDVAPRPDATDFTSLETTDNARTAMAKMLATSFGKTDNITGTAYPTTISNLIGTLSVDASQYDTLLSTLVSNGSLTAVQKQHIDDELSVLSHYATDFKLSTTPVDFTSAPASNTVNQTFTKKVTLTVPAAQRYVLSLKASGGISNSSVSIVNATGEGIDISNPNAIVLNNKTKASTDASGKPITVPTTDPMTYTVTYKVDLGQATSGTVTVGWDNGSGGQDLSIENFGLIPANAISEYAGGSQFGYITTLLTNVSTASDLIAFLYGKPGATVADMTGVTDFKGSANAQSIYSMYGNIDQTQIVNRLSDSDVAQFKQLGASNIKNVTDTLSALSTTLANLQTNKTTLADNLPITYFGQVSDDLQNWYNQTMGALNTQYKAWTTNAVSTLQEKPWTEYNSNDNALYYDKAEGDSLYSTISGLVSTTAKQATDTASSAQIIKSNADEFNQMVDTVTKTQNDAKEVIDNTGNLLNSGNGDLKNSKDYYGNFASVLSNTRTDGVNSGKIFDFFSKPLTTKNRTPKARQTTQEFDWRWIVIFLIGLLCGVLGKTWIRPKPKSNEEEVTEET